MVILQIAHVAGQIAHTNTPHVVGNYVVEIDVDANDGRGCTVGTLDIAKARRFPGLLEALDYIRRPSTVRPLRPDGAPNRPGTVFSYEVIGVRDPIPREALPVFMQYGRGQA